MMRRAETLRRIAIQPGDFVVDVGGGHRPFERANLVLEKHSFEGGLHRTEPMHFPAAPVIKADACRLPIPDRGSDLIVASHLIEHLPQPDRFVAEFQRCSARVYLEFPSRWRELMLAWSFHEWLVEADGPVLKFYRNDLPQLFGPFFHEEHDAALGAWTEARHHQLNISLYCRTDELRCEFPSETATQMLLRVRLVAATKSIMHKPLTVRAIPSERPPQLQRRVFSRRDYMGVVPQNAKTKLARSAF